MKSKRSLKLKFSILLSAAIFAPAAPADDCSPIRLDETVTLPNGKVIEGSMVHVQVRNQRSIGSCYAHTSAQIYDAWRFKHGENLQDDYDNLSSGFEIGQRFKIDENSKVESGSRLFKKMDLSINGGFVEKLLPFLLEEGTCSQLELNGLFEEKYNLDVDKYASEVMRKFNGYRNEFYKARAAILAKHYPPQDQDPTGPNYTGLRLGIRPTYIDNLRVVNPSVNARIAMDDAAKRAVVAKEIAVERERFLKAALAELRETHKNILTNKSTYKGIKYRELEEMGREWKPDDINTVKMFEKISIINCVEARRLLARGRYEVDTTTTYSRGLHLFDAPTYHPTKIRAVLDAELNKGLEKAYPIGIGYCSALFGEGRAFKTKVWGKKENDCGRHASLIIGRRRDPTNTNRCQYLIRNSWGNGCGAYHSDWECDGPKGSVWIDAETLGRATHDLQTLRTISD